jgi:D-serine deaminase-like pyridoxal phosphate-dependent protein
MKKTNFIKISKPTLIIDRARCQRNIQLMADKAKTHNLIFRPHFKTHQSLEIGRWFKNIGIDKITVSSWSMASYFADEWQDITVAFPFNVLEIDTANALASKISLNVLVESPETVRFLHKNSKYHLGVFIKIDVGSHRTGVLPSHTFLIDAILHQIEKAPGLTFLGFLTHAGHTYRCRSIGEIQAAHHECLEQLRLLKQKYRSNYPQLMITIGDTPGCSVADEFDDVDEIRPGNFVYYDLMQVQIGACAADQIGVAVACPIVAKHAERHEIVIYGGGIHFSKERLEHKVYGIIYGQVVEKKGDGWGQLIPSVYLRSLSQEHGVVVVGPERFDEYHLGDLLYVLPIHSCMTANLMMGPLSESYKFI